MRNFTVIDAPQRSPEWRQARAGRLTGSMSHVILAQGRQGKESVQRRDYRLQLVAERLCGEADETYLGGIPDVRRGIELEPLAFAAYEARYGAVVRKTGFLSHNEYMAGCSLDGDINEFSGIVELKCPKLATHLAYLATPDELRAEYITQVRHNLWITGAAFCDLISFYDRLSPVHQLVRLRVEAFDAKLPEYEAAARTFLGEVDAQYSLLINSGKQHGTTESIR